MAARADVVSPTGIRVIHDSTKVPPAAWDQLRADRHAGVVDVLCPKCRGRMTVRLSTRDTQYFAHFPNESPDCVNRAHEGETDEHRETADLLALDVETIGGRAEREWRFDGGVADVAAWSPKDKASGSPSSILEYERKSETLDAYRERDVARFRALGQAAAERSAWRKTVIWVARQQHASTYLRLPQLYLSPDGAKVNDGVFHWSDTTALDDGTARPVLLDRTEAVDMALGGRIARVEGAIYLRGDSYGEGSFGDVWLTRPGVAAKERGRRRRTPKPRLFVPSVTDECNRPPLTDHVPCAACKRPMPAYEVEIYGEVCAACEARWQLPLLLEASTFQPPPPPERRPAAPIRPGWPPCSKCGYPMAAGQRGSHHSCKAVA